MSKLCLVPALALFVPGCTTSKFIDTQGIPYRLPKNAFRITERGVGFDQAAPLKIEVEHLVVAGDELYWLDFETGCVTDDVFEVEVGNLGFFGKASLEGSNRVPEAAKASLTFVLAALQAAGGVASKFSAKAQIDPIVATLEQYADSVAVRADRLKANARVLRESVGTATERLKGVEASLELPQKRRELAGRKSLYTSLSALKALDVPTLARLVQLAQEIADLETAIATKEQESTFVSTTKTLEKQTQELTQAEAKAKDLAAQAKVYKERSARLRLWSGELDKAEEDMAGTASPPPGVDVLKALIEAYYAEILKEKEPPTKETVEVMKKKPRPDEDPVERRLSPKVVQDEEIRAVAILVRDAAGFYGGEGVLHRAPATIVNSVQEARTDADKVAADEEKGRRLYYVVFEN